MVLDATTARRCNDLAFLRATPYSNSTKVVATVRTHAELACNVRPAREPFAEGTNGGADAIGGARRCQMVDGWLCLHTFALDSALLAIFPILP
jgi:hypothetical protein